MNTFEIVGAAVSVVATVAAFWVFIVLLFSI
jgi:hypothetical protein